MSHPDLSWRRVCVYNEGRQIQRRAQEDFSEIIPVILKEPATEESPARKAPGLAGSVLSGICPRDGVAFWGMKCLLGSDILRFFKC